MTGVPRAKPCLQDEYTILNSKHAIGIHGFVLVYSVASRKSFDMVQIVYDKIVNFCGLNQIPCVIVGSKTDLQNRYVSGSVCARRLERDPSILAPTISAPHQKSRQVQPEEGQQLAKQNHAAWVETSAKTNTNVGTCFLPAFHAPLVWRPNACRVPQARSLSSVSVRSRRTRPPSRATPQPKVALSCNSLNYSL